MLDTTESIGASEVVDARAASLSSGGKTSPGRLLARSLITWFAAASLLAGSGCLSESPDGLAPAAPARTTVVMDFFHKPLPDIPLPNDVATRYDPDSPTDRRINASMIAPTWLESRSRQLIDTLDGWGAFQTIAIPFSGPLDVESIRRAHDDPDYDLSDDVIYLVNVDPDSPELGRFHRLDLGNGNYPVVLESLDRYGRNDPRGWSLSLLFEEADEDVDSDGRLDPGEDTDRDGQLDPGEDIDGDGQLDPPEDTDADGVLDVPNYLPGAAPERDDLAGRADALMTFYERETHTLLARPLVPLRERTTYAVIVTRRLLDANGRPVGSPYPFINHQSQTAALAPLAGILDRSASQTGGLGLDDVAFAFTYTTQSTTAPWLAVRDGLYGFGVQGHLGREYPAVLDEVFEIWDEDVGRSNPHIIYTEQWSALFDLLLSGIFGVETGTHSYRAITDTWRYIDYQVFASFTSPQLFERYDENGDILYPLEQAWPPDLDRVPAPARPETIHVWITVPRRENSARGEGQPAPVAILAHGYGSMRLELLPYAGFFAKYGFATVAIDDVSHGLVIDDEEIRLIGLLLEQFGLGPLRDVLSAGRALDLDGDGDLDGGADFWSGYLFHTRDMVRQSALDHMQLLRILRSFDGQRRWEFDLDGDGENELAGDFDGDGEVDLGGEDVLYAGLGGSLGGIMMVVLGSLEPVVDAVVPVSGGAGLFDVALRSENPGVPEAVMMLLMGPIYIGTLDLETGDLAVETQLTDLRRLATKPIATVSDVRVGDTLVALNRSNGERGCGYISETGQVRAPLPSDRGDRHEVHLYRGPALVLGDTECRVVPGLQPYAVIESFEEAITFQADEYAEGDPLVALGDGLGLRRANPELRRALIFAQLAAEPADPAVYARHLNLDPVTYPYTGETTGAHAMIVTTNGDMAVPANAGIALGRAAGLVDYLEPDSRYGVPPNQELIDTYTAEAVNKLRRYTNAITGEGVHIDVENFSRGSDIWGDSVPRLDPPLHLWSRRNTHGDELDGISGAIYPYPVPEGMHGFPFPGDLSDEAVELCRDACEGDDCGCDDVETFDVGNFLFNTLGRYLRSEGQVFDIDLCNSSNDCEDFPPFPEARPRSELD